MSKTKIVCTIGPVCSDRKILELLIDSGMSVARLNGSHNTLDWHKKIIKLIRNIDPMVPILFDLPGRKVRTSKQIKGYKLIKGKSIIITSDGEYNGNDKVPVNYRNLHRDLKKGDILLADDGTLKFRVTNICGKDIMCQILTNGLLKGGKGINVPYIKINTPLVTDVDREMIKFALDNEVDFIGVSFVDSGYHVRKIKEMCGDKIGIISKIENEEGVKNLEEILKESSGVMIDRGDLSAETKYENIGLIQKEIIVVANNYGKPVIIATEILSSMVDNDRPTKAEVMDITNSILDGASAIMLSEETAIGLFPVQSVKVMSSIAKEVENSCHNYLKFDTNIRHKTIPNAIGKSIYEVCKGMPITKVVCITLSGYAARMISRYRINQPIIALTDSIKKARSFNLIWGVEGVAEKIDFQPKNNMHILRGLKALWKKRLINRKDFIIITAVIFPQKGNKMNYLEVHKVKDLVELFG